MAKHEDPRTFNTEKVIASAAKTSTHYVYDAPGSSITMRILSQCSGAEIEIYAQWVVSVVSQQLRQSIQGQRNINTALSNLPIYRLPDEKVQLGWTLEHALRNQGVHEGGYEHLALEVLLTEAFSEVYAARVLHEMAVAYAGPEDITPHFTQLRNQVRSSNGIFTSTQFARLVEDYLKLDPFNRVLKGGSRTFSVASPKSCADALWLLSKITDGREKQMTIIGGPVIAWFAAAGEWLYDLRLSVFNADGEQLSSTHNERSSQLLLIYTSYSGIIAQAGSWSNDAEQAKKVAKGSLHADFASISSTQFGGRLVYTIILNRVFGSSFHHLDREESKTFATAIGSCARILEDIAENHDPSRSTKRPTASYGQGLLDTLCNWLPELRHLQARMERQLQLTAEDAGRVYTDQIQHLRKVCGCDICSPDSDENKKPALEGYCLPSLVETIIALGLLLSNITVAAAIFPTRFGLQTFYLKQADKRQQAMLNNLSGNALFQSLYYDVPDTMRLAQVAEIFSGSPPTRDLHPNLVALAHEGVCVFLSRQMTRNDSDDGLINVTSGGVCVRQKVYTRACLGPVDVEDDLSDLWEEVKCTHLAKSLWCK